MADPDPDLDWDLDSDLNSGMSMFADMFVYRAQLLVVEFMLVVPLR